jgi:hypothetical protein
MGSRGEMEWCWLLVGGSELRGVNREREKRRLLQDFGAVLPSPSKQNKTKVIRHGWGDRIMCGDCGAAARVALLSSLINFEIERDR